MVEEVMNVSLITTVKNEEESIEKFLGSISNQSRKPEEIIIVDGGSSDNTLSIIYNLLPKIKIPTRILKKKGNRSVGRNTAIKNSSYNIIACSDAGCTLDKYWVERITKPFEDKTIDVVAGFYKPITNSVFEKCLAAYTCTMPERLNPKNFLPSSRSISFRKSAWAKVKGYPEDLNTCEDLVFDKRLKKARLKFVTIKNATVYWPQKKNIVQAAKQFYLYAVGDGKAKYFRSSTPFLFLRYILGGVFFVYIVLTKEYFLLSMIYYLLILYFIWSIWKNYKYVNNWKAFIYLPVLQITSDISVLTGTTYGIILQYDSRF